MTQCKDSYLKDIPMNTCLVKADANVGELTKKFGLVPRLRLQVLERLHVAFLDLQKR